jgi:uncharacterized membrane protein
MENQSEPAGSSTGLDENLAGLLCYLLGFITGIVFLVIEKQSSFVRFHAMQSTFTFVGLFILSIVVGVIPLMGRLIAAIIPLVSLVVWILMMVKAYQGERFKLPIVGDMVEKQLGGA